ncbi:MAG: transglycosylase SLT domain-containing protein [Pseudomonadales bacterium]|nr:transglycosylase SLT domain-containing protein [Pseudomonadales bacterium]
MYRTITAFCLALIASQAFSGFSNNDSPAMSRFEQRQLYQQAIDSARGNQRSRTRELAEKLKDYPLYPYIEYTDKIYHITREDAASIMDFIARNPDTPLADQLLENWVYVQAKQGNWETFVKYYREDLTGDRNACYYAYALYKTGHKDEAFDAAKRLWLVPYSQPDECDAVFKAWRDAGELDRDAAWGRFALAVKSNELSLAGYLTRFLDEADHDLADAARQVQRRPQTITQYRKFASDDARTRDVILHGLRRLSYRDAPAALTALEHYRGTHTFALEDVSLAYADIGVQLAIDGDPQSLLDSIPIDLGQNEPLVEARIRLALKKQAYSEALVFINLLPDDEKETPRWRYWQARILAASTDQKDRDTATQIYTDLAKLRNFYGFMSADALGTDYEFGDTPGNVDENEVRAMEARPGIQRALELFTLDERNRARREWYFATRDFSDHQLQVAARVARKWGWYRQAIKSMIDAEAWDDLELRFPLAYQDSFVSNARVWDIPLHWSYAIARQESAFMPDARSVAGAMGIMQLMPATARHTADVHGLSLDTSTDLVEPAVNIRLGSAYLGSMLRRFHNNRILASAAYNAGPARVERWLDPSLPMDVWVETIPFAETRNYVQNVLMYAAIYAKRLSQSAPLIYAHELQDFGDGQITNAPTRMASK